MQTSNTPAKREQRRPYVMAVVLGTALTALGGAPASAAQPETTLRAVNDLSRYCTTCWRNARLHPDVWTDCTQEVLSRLLERVSPDGWSRLLRDDGEERREFLRAIDAVKKRHRRSKQLAAGAGRGSRRPPRPAPPRCCRRARGCRPGVGRAAQRTTAAHRAAQLRGLERPRDRRRAAYARPSAVSDEKYKAIRKLRGRLAEMS